MAQFDKKIQKTILLQASEVFPSSSTQKGQIVKIEEEPYSYWVGSTKMYIFENHEIANFLSWYWQNCKETFIFDILTNIESKVIWKYFCKTVPNFATNNPSAEAYNENKIEEDIVVNGIEAFIKSITNYWR